MTTGGYLLNTALNEYAAVRDETEVRQALALAAGLMKPLTRQYEKNLLQTGVSPWRDEYTATETPGGEPQRWRTAVYGQLPEVAWLVAEAQCGQHMVAAERGIVAPPGGAGQPAYQQALYAGTGLTVADQSVPAAAMLSGGSVVAAGQPLPARSWQPLALPAPTWAAYTRGYGFPVYAFWLNGGMEGQIYNGYLASRPTTGYFYPGLKLDGNGVFVNPLGVEIGQGASLSGDVRIISAGRVIIRDRAVLKHAFIYARSGIEFGNNVAFAGVAVTPGAITVGRQCSIAWDNQVLQSFHTPVTISGKELISWN